MKRHKRRATTPKPGDKVFCDVADDGVIRIVHGRVQPKGWMVTVQEWGVPSHLSDQEKVGITWDGYRWNVDYDIEWT